MNYLEAFDGYNQALKRLYECGVSGNLRWIEDPVDDIGNRGASSFVSGQELRDLAREVTRHPQGPERRARLALCACDLAQERGLAVLQAWDGIEEGAAQNDVTAIANAALQDAREYKALMSKSVSSALRENRRVVSLPTREPKTQDLRPAA